jgi:hypothetical protein
MKIMYVFGYLLLFFQIKYKNWNIHVDKYPSEKEQSALDFILKENKYSLQV